MCLTYHRWPEGSIYQKSTDLLFKNLTGVNYDIICRLFVKHHCFRNFTNIDRLVQSVATASDDLIVTIKGAVSNRCSGRRRRTIHQVISTDWLRSGCASFHKVAY